MNHLSRNTYLLLFSCGFVPAATWAQNPGVTQLVPADLGDPDLELYGQSVAIDRQRAIVGAVVDTHQGDRCGSAYIFERNGTGGWIERAKLHPSSSFSLEDAHFGESVAISGDRALIGAPQEGDLGYVYAFERTQDGSWLQTDKFTADDIAFYDHFGVRVALSGGRALIVSYSFAGQDMFHSAYIFERDSSGAWTQMAKLFAPAIGSPRAPFEAASLDRDRALLGCPGGAGAVLGTGIALLFEREFDGSWPLAATFWAPDGENGDDFGCAVSIEGDRAAVGAYQDDDPGRGSGSAHVFERDADGTWAHVVRVETIAEAFGWELSLAGGRLLVGAPYSAVQAADAGLAFVFERQADGTWTREHRLLACGGGNGSKFGRAVSIAGDLALVGSPFHEGAPGECGAAYVFDLASEGDPCGVPPGSYHEESKLLASDGDEHHRFGWTLSYSQGRALVGGDSHYIGTAYVFEPSGPSGSWTQVAELLPEGDQIGMFGTTVSLFGDRAVVGAPESYVSGLPRVGDAYVFERQITGSWIQVARLLSSDGEEGDYFGESVSLGHDRVVVGARHARRAYVFERQADGTWFEADKLKAADGNHLSGGSVALFGDEALVGAYLPDMNPGSAYLFRRSTNGNWIQAAELMASDGLPGDRFGYAVALSEDRAIVGGMFTDGVYLFERLPDETWIETAKISVENGAYPGWWSVSLLGDHALIGARGGNGGTGAAHLFELAPWGSWTEVQRFVASDGAQGDLFGLAVHLTEETVLIGAPDDDDQGDEAGSAYVFPVDL